MLTVRESSHKPMIREQLLSIPVVKPDHVKDRWMGVQHGELANTITELAEEKKLKIKKENWFVNGPNLSCLQGSLVLEIPNMRQPEKGVEFSLGVLHSNNADIAIRFAVGARVVVCSNGLVVGDFVLNKKHTTGLNMKDQVNWGLDNYLEQVVNVQPAIQQMRERGVVTKDVDRILMQAGREGLMPWSRIGMVEKEFRLPRFKEFKEPTAWSLYNAYTFTEQKCRPRDQIRSMRRFKEIILN